MIKMVELSLRQRAQVFIAQFENSDGSLAIWKRLNPTIDPNSGAQAIHPERIILKDVAHFRFVLRFDDP